MPERPLTDPGVRFSRTEKAYSDEVMAVGYDQKPIMQVCYPRLMLLLRKLFPVVKGGVFKLLNIADAVDGKESSVGGENNESWYD